jgi:ribonuclease BN (tRNA processing enzyme)
MRVTFLGTGSAMPVAGRAQTGLLIGDSLLVDCGAGVLARLAEHGDYESLSAVLLTHLHTDHVSDLVALLKARWLAGCGSLDVVGPDGTERLLDDLVDAHDYLRGRVSYEVREHDGSPGRVAGYDVTACEATHSGPAFAYRIGDFTFSGDTEASEAVASLAEGTTALAHDCSFPDGVEADNHPTASELGGTLAGRDCGTVYLTHLYPAAAADEDGLRDSVTAAYGGAVRVARDGLTVDV